MSGRPLALARIDADGILQSADPRLMDLLKQAGSGLGEAIAQPALAGLVRLAQRLGIAVTRTIALADGDDDLDLAVRADPDGEGVSIIVSDWHVRPAWRPAGTPADRVPTNEDWVWRCDGALCLTQVTANPAAPVECDTSILLGERLDRILDFGDDPNAAWVALTERRAFEGQHGVLRATGRPLTVSGIPEFDAQGRFAGFAGWVVFADQDIPDAEVDGLARRLDHALRLPLERIVANAGSMSAALDGPLADSYIGYAEDIATAGRHLLGLVTDLVDLETVERKDFTILSEPIDLADVARRAAGLLAVRATDAGVRIDRPGIDDILPATGDFRRALQVLVNLIGNAVRYSSQGGLIRVQAEQRDGQARIIVVDQGKGIAARDHALIFEKFGRVDPGESGGSGLGLYISRRLARAMGGDLTVDSAAGQGARFVFTLPGADGLAADAPRD